MKQLFQISLIALFSLSFFAIDLSAQEFRKIDASPLDMVYAKNEETKAPIARVIYSRPQMKEREIFGELIPFDKVWRTGANEAVEIMFFQDVSINGEAVEAGRYQLFTIPNEDNWIVILNSKTDEWGAYNYDESADVLRAEVGVKKLKRPVEVFSMAFAEAEDGIKLQMAWDKTLVELPIEY